MKKNDKTIASLIAEITPTCTTSPPPRVTCNSYVHEIQHSGDGIPYMGYI